MQFGALSPEERVAILERHHRRYAEKVASWALALDAYEGQGGFEDGTHLRRFPREMPEDFVMRKEMARYHNYDRALINLYVRHVFGKGVKRESTDEALSAWWEDLDGRQQSLTTWMKRALKLALALGHVGCLVDKTPDAPTGPSVADDQGDVLLSLILPMALTDWRLDPWAEAIAVKIVEPAPDPPMGAQDEPDPADVQYLVWDRQSWARFDAHGQLLESDDATQLGVVPFAMLRPDPSSAYPFFGIPLLGDPKIAMALYNRSSEEDTVLRDQSFSVLAVEVPIGGDVQKARDSLGDEVGTTRAVVVEGTVDYKTPDQNVPTALRDNQAYLVQERYRMAHVRFAKESLDAESADSIRLQNQELNEMLAGCASACQAFELALTRLWFAWMSPTADAATAAFDAADVHIEYPKEFFISDMIAELDKLAKAIALDLGGEFEKVLKKGAVQELAPDLDEATKAAVFAEIDTLPSKQERQADMLEQTRQNAVARFGAAQRQPREPAA